MYPASRRTRRGTLWQLGPHRLLCGDATSPADVERLLDGSVPHLMATDPPYGVKYDPSWRQGLVNRSDARSKIAGDDRVDWSDAYRLFPGDVAYVWHGGLQADIVARSLRESGFQLRAQIVWAKSRFAISRGHYHWQHETCYYAVRKGRTGHWRGDRKQTTVWQILAMPGALKRDPTETKSGHGAQKPIEVMARPIRNNSAPGELVYDPFLGSGTTLIAAEREGRICYGLELEPHWCDVIVARWEAETGREAVRL
ncbi:DNA-methyltransferase [Methyloceanibacter caenitepidi]|uniref:Methyltransferase n=1 Tax=Methyloceanibacter caenitepidi TaxID=1384459 RepID=A0A0A8K208_9HYPH|nr:site-specific DNA-methyltransferase [Methyloceanibacter caenitepidi]BAQ16930.1 DNA modification methylase [Methyloceanibacter caenitepidi]